MVDIVLGDDHLIFVDALVAVLILEGFKVVAAASSLARVVEAVSNYKPDVCLLDRYFADGDGIEAISDVIAVSPRTNVLMLTADIDANAMLRALEFGALGYVHKTWGVAALTSAIKRVGAGEIVIDPPRTCRRGFRADEAHRLVARLTARERECLGMLTDGLDTGAMAVQLAVSTTTVRSHVQALLTKLGVHSRLEAASLAVRFSLVENGLSARRGLPPQNGQGDAL